MSSATYLIRWNTQIRHPRIWNAPDAGFTQVRSTVFIKYQYPSRHAMLCVLAFFFSFFFSPNSAIAFVASPNLPLLGGIRTRQSRTNFAGMRTFSPRCLLYVSAADCLMMSTALLSLPQDKASADGEVENGRRVPSRRAYLVLTRSSSMHSGSWQLPTWKTRAGLYQYQG